MPKKTSGYDTDDMTPLLPPFYLYTSFGSGSETRFGTLISSEIQNVVTYLPPRTLLNFVKPAGAVGLFLGKRLTT